MGTSFKVNLGIYLVHHLKNLESKYLFLTYGDTCCINV